MEKQWWRNYSKMAGVSFVVGLTMIRGSEKELYMIVGMSLIGLAIVFMAIYGFMQAKHSR